MSVTTIDGTVTIPADHPALDGHFPGRPIVPGVVLLAEAARLFADRLAARIVAIDRAKFLAPVAPGEPVTITAAIDGGRASIAATASGRPVLAGTLRLG